jgi:hypothetical protein
VPDWEHKFFWPPGRLSPELWRWPLVWGILTSACAQGRIVEIKTLKR